MLDILILNHSTLITINCFEYLDIVFKVFFFFQNILIIYSLNEIGNTYLVKQCRRIACNIPKIEKQNKTNN